MAQLAPARETIPERNFVHTRADKYIAISARFFVTERSCAAISGIVPVGLLGSTFAGYVLSGLSEPQPNYTQSI